MKPLKFIIILILADVLVVFLMFLWNASDYFEKQEVMDKSQFFELVHKSALMSIGSTIFLLAYYFYDRHKKQKAS